MKILADAEVHEWFAREVPTSEFAGQRVLVIIPDATRKLLVLVHGSSMTDRQWLRHEHDHGARLEKDLGYTTVYVLYNSGLHISANGRELDSLLERLASAWPVPIDEIVLLEPGEPA